MVSQPTAIGRAYHRAVIIGVDIGNSAAKAALIDGSTVREAGRLDTSVASTADLTAGLRMLVEKARVPPDSIVAISVVDRWTARLERAAGTLGLPLTVAGADRIPLLTALPRPDLTGPDRLLAAWAASVLHGRPVVVVDLGTATTVDAVDADGFFLGGAILPGLGLAARALAEGTARLPRVELELPDDAIGVDTAAALQSGIVIGHLGAVRELVTRMRERLASQVGLIGAGAIDLPELGPSAPGPPVPGPSPARLLGTQGRGHRRSRRCLLGARSLVPAGQPEPARHRRRAGSRARVARSGPARRAHRHPTWSWSTVMTDRPLEGRLILLGVTGSIAAYKAAELLRQLVVAGAEVQVMMTSAATHFIGPLTLETLSGRPVMLDPLELQADRRISHIVAADSAAAVLVAPATARWLGAMANGLADDVITATCLATRAPVVVAPAMDGDMFAHPATVGNVRRLREFGYTVVDPASGPLASGQVGVGRLASLPLLVETVVGVVAGRPADLAGWHIVVSAGGTAEPIDPVRFIGNRSSGRMGFAIAEAALERGARVTLVKGTTSVPPPDGRRAGGGRDDRTDARGRPGGTAGLRCARHGRGGGRLPAAQRG